MTLMRLPEPELPDVVYLEQLTAPSTPTAARTSTTTATS